MSPTPPAWRTGPAGTKSSRGSTREDVFIQAPAQVWKNNARTRSKSMERCGSGAGPHRRPELGGEPGCES